MLRVGAALGRSRLGPLVRAMSSKAGAPLVHWDSKTCPYAQRSWQALVEKQLPFEIRLVDLANKSEEFNATYRKVVQDPDAPAKVPILIDGETELVESLVILDYLDSKYPHPIKLYPEDPAQAAKVRLWIELFGTRLTGSLISILRADSAAGVAAGVATLTNGLTALDAFLRLHGSEDGGDLFLGGRYSAADLATVPFVQRAAVALPAFRGIDLRQLVRDARLDRLDRWMTAAMARPSAQQTVPDDEVIVKSWSKFVTPLQGPKL